MADHPTPWRRGSAEEHELLGAVAALIRAPQPRAVRNDAAKRSDREAQAVRAKALAHLARGRRERRVHEISLGSLLPHGDSGPSPTPSSHWSFGVSLALSASTCSPAQCGHGSRPPSPGRRSFKGMAPPSGQRVSSW